MHIGSECNSKRTRGCVQPALHSALPIPQLSSALPCAARRHHLELQWQRQAEQDALLAGVPAALQSGGVLEVQSLQHLERILEAASGQLVVLTVYSRCAGGLGRGDGQGANPCDIPATKQRLPVRGIQQASLAHLPWVRALVSGLRTATWKKPLHDARTVQSCWNAVDSAMPREPQDPQRRPPVLPQKPLRPSRRVPAACSSCGICKAVLRELEAVCAESRQQRARIVFLRHDLHDAFDWPSDVARMYTIKSAPRFLFFVDVSGPNRTELCRWRAPLPLALVAAVSPPAERAGF